jgi:hypothetical protein
MNVSNIGSNQTEIRLTNGVRILVSYKTPVAAYHPFNGWMRCSGESRTTMKHISQWCGKGVGKIVSREEIADLINPTPVQRKSNKIRGDQPRVIRL